MVGTPNSGTAAADDPPLKAGLRPAEPPLPNRLEGSGPGPRSGGDRQPAGGQGEAGQQQEQVVGGARPRQLGAGGTGLGGRRAAGLRRGGRRLRCGGGDRLRLGGGGRLRGRGRRSALRGRGGGVALRSGGGGGGGGRRRSRRRRGGGRLLLVHRHRRRRGSGLAGGGRRRGHDERAVHQVGVDLAVEVVRTGLHVRHGVHGALRAGHDVAGEEGLGRHVGGEDGDVVTVAVPVVEPDREGLAGGDRQAVLVELVVLGREGQRSTRRRTRRRRRPGS